MASKLEKAEHEAAEVRRVQPKIVERRTSSTITPEQQMIRINRILDMYVGQTKKRSDAAAERHADNKCVKKFVIDAYKGGVKWSSKLRAAKAITPKAIEFAKTLSAPCLRTDRAQQTVYEWILAS